MAAQQSKNEEGFSGVAAGLAFAGAVGAPLISGVAGAVFAPATRATQYEANVLLPNLRPTATDYIRLWNAGFIDWPNLVIAVSQYGINANSDEWKNIILMSAAMPPLETVLQQRRLGKLTIPVYNELIRIHGLKQPAWNDLIINPWVSWTRDEARILNELGGLTALEYEQLLKASGATHHEDREKFERLTKPPGPGEILDLVRRGLPPDVAEKYLILNGYTDSEARNSLLSLAERVLGVPESLDLRRRGLITEQELNEKLEANGLGSEQSRQAVKDLGKNIPSVGEILQMAGRRIFDSGSAGPWNLEEGLEDQPGYLYWTKVLGLTEGGTDLPDSPDTGKDFRKLLWKSNRMLPTFMDARLMLHLCRPVVGQEGSTAGENIPPWTEEDTLRLLKLQNVPADLANHLRGILYDPVTIQNTRVLIEELLIHPEEQEARVGGGVNQEQYFESLFLDMGLSPKNAKLMAWANAQHVLDKSMVSVRKKRRDLVLEKYRHGLLGRDAAAKDLLDFETSEVEAKAMMENTVNDQIVDVRRETNKLILKAYEIGAQDRASTRKRLTSDKADAINVDSLLNNIDAVVHLRLLGEQLKSIESGFMRGNTSEFELPGILKLAGFTDERSTQYIQEWKYQRHEQRRMLNTGEILALLKDGLITPDQAWVRLNNLGWDNVDSLIEIQKVQYDLASKLAGQQARAASAAMGAAAKAQAQASKANAKAQAATAKQAKANVAASYELLEKRNRFFASFAAAHKAFAKASDKGDVDGMDAARYKIMADWHSLNGDLADLLVTAVPSPQLVASLEVGAVPVAKALATPGSPPPPPPDKPEGSNATK